MTKRILFKKWLVEKLRTAKFAFQYSIFKAFNPTMPGRGKYLPRWLWRQIAEKVIMYVILKKNIYSCRNESFLTSCSTSKNDVLTYIFNDLTSKVGPRHHSVAPISPWRGKNLPRWAPPLRLAVPVNIPISCRSRSIQSVGGGGFGLSRSFYTD